MTNKDSKISVIELDEKLQDKLDAIPKFVLPGWVLWVAFLFALLAGLVLTWYLKLPPF